MWLEICVFYIISHTPSYHPQNILCDCWFCQQRLWMKSPRMNGTWPPSKRGWNMLKHVERCWSIRVCLNIYTSKIDPIFITGSFTMSRQHRSHIDGFSAGRMGCSSLAIHGFLRLVSNHWVGEKAAHKPQILTCFKSKQVLYTVDSEL